MAIIISTNGKKAVKVEKSSIDKEDYLQKYIYENPESIPLYEIKEDISLLILAREFPTNSGPVDAIGVDKYGDLYIVETKLYANADKRKVVAQSLDYGAALWKHSNDFNEFLRILNIHTQKAFTLGAVEKISEFFELEEDEVSTLLDKVRSNLNNGVFRFVVLMDKLDDRLKDLILFVNQNSQFDIYAVEFEYYKHDTQEIIIPRIFGTEVKKDIAVSTPSSARRKWTEETLLQDAREKLTSEEYKAFEKIYAFSKQNATELRFGTGACGSFSPIFKSVDGMSLFTLSIDKRLSFNFGWMEDGVAEKFKSKLTAIGFSFPDNFKELHPNSLSEEWLPKADEFIKVVEEMLEDK